jgi:hypothetical protein
MKSIVVCLFISIVYCQNAKCLYERESYKTHCILQKEEIPLFLNPSWFFAKQSITTLRIKSDVKGNHKILVEIPKEYKYQKDSQFEVECFYNPSLEVGSLSLDYNCDYNIFQMIAYCWNRHIDIFSCISQL